MIYTCIKYPLPRLVHIIGNNDSHLSLNHQYVSSIVDSKIDGNCFKQTLASLPCFGRIGSLNLQLK